MELAILKELEKGGTLKFWRTDPKCWKRNCNDV